MICLTGRYRSLIVSFRIYETKAILTDTSSVFELRNNLLEWSACCVLVLYVPSWNDGACHFSPVINHGSNRLIACLVVNSLFKHKALLQCVKISLADYPRVCECDRADLTVEGLFKGLLYCGHTSTSCRMGYNWYLIESWVFDVMAPYENGVPIHARDAWNLSTCRGVSRIVRVHH